MIKWLGASVAAVGIACASAAAADVVVFQESGTAQSFFWYSPPNFTEPGNYRLEFITSAPVRYRAEYFYRVHWDLVIAPGHPHAGGILEGNTIEMAEIRNDTGTALYFDFSVPADWTDPPYPSPFEQYWYGSIPIGTMVQVENHIELFQTGIYTEDSYGRVFDYSLRIIRFSPVPEPATWAMLIGGFGLAGTALRSRRRAVA